MYQLVVIGAGPAGLMAATKAAEEGLSVLLLEKMEKPARKLRITGKGRCNITNTRTEVELMQKIFPNARFFRPAFRNLTNEGLVQRLNDNGLETIVERGDRVFPASQRAWDVADVLVDMARRAGVEIRCHAKVIALQVENDEVKSLTVEHNGTTEELNPAAVVVATGGLSYPSTGSTGDGYRWAEQLGISITPTRPSLVGLYAKHPDIRLAGLELRNVSLQLWIEGNRKDEEFGELSFSEQGVEGAIVLRLSRQAIDALDKKSKVHLRLDLKSALSEEQLRQRIQREIEAGLQPATVEGLLRKLMPAQMILPFAEKAGVSAKQRITEFGRSGVQRIVACLKCYEMELGGYEGYERAVVTAGGISLTELDSKTMHAKAFRNLFFAGEVVDLDADTGGFNLQIAFSTGYLAGLSAARMLDDKKKE